MKKVILGIGVPGSGKTTLLKAFAEKNGYLYVCPDDIRAELTGNPADQSKNKEVWQEAYKRLSELLARGDTVVFDATFAKDGDRKNFIEYARKHGAEKIQGVFIDLPIEIAKERNKSRERVVPGEAMDRMHSWLKENPPHLTDGFDSLFVFDSEHKLVDTSKRPPRPLPRI